MAVVFPSPQPLPESPPPAALKRKHLFTPFLMNLGEIRNYIKKLVGRQASGGTCPDTEALCREKLG